MLQLLKKKWQSVHLPVKEVTRLASETGAILSLPATAAAKIFCMAVSSSDTVCADYGSTPFMEEKIVFHSFHIKQSNKILGKNGILIGLSKGWVMLKMHKSLK